MGLTITNLEPEIPALFWFSYLRCSFAEVMASRNKVARRKGKVGGGDEVSRCDWALPSGQMTRCILEIKLTGVKLNRGSG